MNVTSEYELCAELGEPCGLANGGDARGWLASDDSHAWIATSEGHAVRTELGDFTDRSTRFLSEVERCVALEFVRSNRAVLWAAIERDAVLDRVSLWRLDEDVVRETVVLRFAEVSTERVHIAATPSGEAVCVFVERAGEPLSATVFSATGERLGALSSSVSRSQCAMIDAERFVDLSEARPRLRSTRGAVLDEIEWGAHRDAIFERVIDGRRLLFSDEGGGDRALVEYDVDARAWRALGPAVVGAMQWADSVGAIWIAGEDNDEFEPRDWVCVSDFSARWNTFAKGIAPPLVADWQSAPPLEPRVLSCSSTSALVMSRAQPVLVDRQLGVVTRRSEFAAIESLLVCDDDDTIVSSDANGVHRWWSIVHRGQLAERVDARGVSSRARAVCEGGSVAVFREERVTPAPSVAIVGCAVRGGAVEERFSLSVSPRKEHAYLQAISADGAWVCLGFARIAPEIYRRGEEHPYVSLEALRTSVFALTFVDGEPSLTIELICGTSDGLFWRRYRLREPEREWELVVDYPPPSPMVYPETLRFTDRGWVAYTVAEDLLLVDRAAPSEERVVIGAGSDPTMGRFEFHCAKSGEIVAARWSMRDFVELSDARSEEGASVVVLTVVSALDRPSCMALSPNGAVLAVGTERGCVRVFVRRGEGVS